MNYKDYVGLSWLFEETSYCWCFIVKRIKFYPLHWRVYLIAFRYPSEINFAKSVKCIFSANIKYTCIPYVNCEHGSKKIPKRHGVFVLDERTENKALSVEYSVTDLGKRIPILSGLGILHCLCPDIGHMTADLRKLNHIIYIYWKNLLAGRWCVISLLCLFYPEFHRKYQDRSSC